MTAAPAIRPIPEEEELTEQPVEQATSALYRVPLPAGIQFSRPLSDEELLQFCSENDGLEIESDVDGSITVMTPAKFKTSTLNQPLTLELGLWARQIDKGKVCGPDLGVRFSDSTLRAPNAGWISDERVAEAEEQEKRGLDFSISVRSSSRSCVRTATAPRRLKPRWSSGWRAAPSWSGSSIPVASWRWFTAQARKRRRFCVRNFSMATDLSKDCRLEMKPFWE